MHSLFEKLCQKFKSLKINYIYFLDHDLFHFGKKYSILGRLAVSLWIVTPLLAEKKTKCGKLMKKAKPFRGLKLMENTESNR